MIWTKFLMKCVLEYCPVQQRQVARPSLLRSLVATGSLMIAHRYWQSSNNGLLARHYCGGQWQWATDVRMPIAIVGASSNRAYATCQIVATVI
jgi:hypothetical protein